MSNNAYTWANEFSELVEKYAEFVMDGMDMKTMEQFVFDSLIDTYSNYSQDELINEIDECYGSEVLESLGVEVTETSEKE